MKNVKKRYWACVFYPESLPDNWVELLINSGVPCCYALHDMDFNPDNTIKKAHYHVILAYDGPTTYKSVCSFLEPFNCPIPQPLEQIRGYFRYLTHKDNPEKFQYDDKIVIPLNGFNIANYSEFTKSELEALKSALIDMIVKDNILEYSDLIEVLHSDIACKSLEEVARNNTTFFKAYLDSRRYKVEKKEKKEDKILSEAREAQRWEEIKNMHNKSREELE